MTHVLTRYLLVPLLLVATAAYAEDSGRLRLATGSVGGTFLPVGHDIAGWLSATLDLDVVVDTTAGSVDNLGRLIEGEADIAIVGSSPFREVLGGWKRMHDEAEEICTLGTLYMDAEQFVVRKSLVRAGNLLDLNGLLMYPGPHNSGGEIDTRRILSTIGVEPRYVYVDERTKGYAAAAAALERGDFDASTFSGGVPIRAVTDLMDAHPGEFIILPFTRHMLRRLQHLHGDYEGVIIRGRSYPGQEESIQTVGGPNLLVARPGLSPELLERIEQVVLEGIQTPGVGLRVSASHPVLQALTPSLWNEIPVGKRCFELEDESLGAQATAASGAPSR